MPTSSFAKRIAGPNASFGERGPAPGGPEPAPSDVERKAVPARTLLLIEDDFATRRALAELLTEEGFEVISAANGAEGFELLCSRTRPAAIVLDIWMPYMDGLEFRALQRSLPEVKDVPVVVITAGGFRPEEVEGLGFTRVLRKPLNEQDVLSAVRELMQPPSSGSS
jgi:CheY-like chemotaxis protein